MTHRPLLEELLIAEADLHEQLLPKLLNQVFHVTSRERFGHIRVAGGVSPNDDGTLGETFPQSRGSIGRRLNAVCLFDLRNRSAAAIQHALDCYYFLGLPQLGNELAFLCLSPVHLPDLILCEQLSGDVRMAGTYIPEVECWHPGLLPLSKITTVLVVTIRRRDRRGALEELVTGSCPPNRNNPNGP